MSAEKGWIGEPQPKKEWHTPGWLSEKGTGHSHFHPELDIAKLRAATAELGYRPATTDDEHLEKLRADNERFDRMNAHDPYHSPCPVCGRPTRFKQWPTRCACNRNCSKEELQQWPRFRRPELTDPVWQEEIRQAKQRVAEHEAREQ